MSDRSSLKLNSAEHYRSLLDAELCNHPQKKRSSTDKILADLQKEFEWILAQAEIDIAEIHTGYLIGSYSRGTAVQPYSDVDVLTFSRKSIHFETMLRWKQQLLTLYVYALQELEQGLTGPDSFLWIQSLKDALPLYGKEEAMQEINRLVAKAEHTEIEKRKGFSLPLVKLRRLIEYRRKAYAEAFMIESGSKQNDDISKMQLADAGRKFIENYLLLKYFMSGKYIESESKIFEMVRTLSADLRIAVRVCMESGNTEQMLNCMDSLLVDIKSALSKPDTIV